MWPIVILSAEYLPQRAKILAQRSNLTPQRARNSLINCMRYRSRFRRKADLLRTFPLVSARDQQARVCSFLLLKEEFLPVTSLLMHAQRKIISMKEDLIDRHIDISYSSRFITKTLLNETLMNTFTRKRQLEYRNSHYYYKHSPRLYSDVLAL